MKHLTEKLGRTPKLEANGVMPMRKRGLEVSRRLTQTKLTLALGALLMGCSPGQKMPLAMDAVGLDDRGADTAFFPMPDGQTQSLDASVPDMIPADGMVRDIATAPATDGSALDTSTGDTDAVGMDDRGADMAIPPMPDGQTQLRDASMFDMIPADGMVRDIVTTPAADSSTRDIEIPQDLVTLDIHQAPDLQLPPDLATSAVSSCGSSLVQLRTNSVVPASTMVTDYPLNGIRAVVHYNILLLLFNASSFSAETPPTSPLYKDYFTPQQLGHTFINDPDGVHAFLQESSYGNVTLSGTVVGWFELGAQNLPADDFRINVDRYVSMADSYVQFGNYDIIYLVGLTDANDSLQVGWLLQNSVNTPQGRFQVGLDWMINSEFWNTAGGPGLYSVILPTRSYAHELIHTIGISGHSLSLNCGNLAVATNCTLNPYGGVFSAMGESAFSNHPDVSMKQKLGWLGTNRFIEVTSSGEHKLCPLETADTAVKGLKIPLKTPIVLDSGAEFDHLFVEYRRPLGFDRYLNRLQSNWLDRYKMDGPVRSDGVIVYLGYTNPAIKSTVLLDMHPVTSYVMNTGIVMPGNTGKFSDAILPVGESFELPNQDIRITTRSLTNDDGVLVNVDR